MPYLLVMNFDPSKIPDVTGARIEGLELTSQYVTICAFAKPMLPIITNEHVPIVKSARWGLIPKWTKTSASAEEISKKTLLSRSEEVWDKPSYKTAIRERRALVPITGFIESQHVGDATVKHYIHMPGREVFTVGAVWEEWLNPDTGVWLRTCALLTTQANALMQHVHNSNPRMSVVIAPEDRKRWLSSNDRAEIDDLMKPLGDGILEAWPLDKSVRVNYSEKVNEHILDPVGPTIRM